MKKPFRKLGIFAFCTVGTLAVVMSIYGVKPDEVYQSRLLKASPIIAFEFVQTEAETKALFFCPEKMVNPESTCSPSVETVLKKMDFINYLDFIFALFYPAFFALFYWLLYQLTKNKTYQYAILLPISITLFDYLENLHLLEISAQLLHNQPFQEAIDHLQIITWIKWLLISIFFASLFFFLFSQKEIKDKVLGILFLSPLLFGITSIFSPDLTFIFALSVSIAVFLLAIYCLIKKQLTDGNHEK